MSPDVTYYFAYGSNTDPGQMKRRAPGAEAIGRAVLRGHRLIFRGVADIEASASGVVHGVLWMVTADDLRRLDEYEGYPRMYGRSERAVQTEHADVFSAIVYKMQPGHAVAAPAVGYLSGILQGAHRFGLPTKGIREALGRAAGAAMVGTTEPAAKRTRRRAGRPSTVSGIIEYPPFIEDDDEHDFEVFRRRLQDWRNEGVTTRGRRLG